MAPLTRRDFLKSAGVLGLSLTHLRWLGTAQAWAATTPLPGHKFKNWEDLYRAQWTWDKVSRNTHFVNCWYQAACNWNIYVKDGIVWREEQAGVYPHPNPEVPDFNPRGCQKGACYSQRMYDPTRVKYPLKRIGKRGEGKWQRVSWDQALTEIADEFVHTLTSEGPAAINWDPGTNSSHLGPQGIGNLRTAFLLDTPNWDVVPEIGDAHHGAAVTMGKIVECSSADDMFYASVILIWGGNPLVTQIPNYHFLSEARYNGTKIVTIAPDYSPSSVHSDLWVPLNVGTDVALALSLSQVIISEKLYNAAFLKEQTDMPLLVCDDTRLFLRESDMKEGGADDRFYVWDTNAKAVAMMPQRTLALGDIDPALEGEYEVTAIKGKVKVRPVFEVLKWKLAEHTPEKTSKICGTNPNLIRRLARAIGKAKAVTTVTQTVFSKYYHGTTMERAEIMVLALCGHFGRRGAGHQAFPYLSAGCSQEGFLYSNKPLTEGKRDFDVQYAAFAKPFKDRGYTEEAISYEWSRAAVAKKATVSSVLTMYLHGGLNELSANQRKWDPSMKRDLDEYLKLSLDKGWQFANPDVPLRILVANGGNVLRRVRGYPKLIEVLLPKLRLLLSINWRIDNTGRYSDYILPVTAWYETNDIRWVTPIAKYIHGAQPAVAPLGEALSQWSIFCRLTKKIQERAASRGITKFKDQSGKERRLDNLHENLTYGGSYREGDDSKLAADFITASDNLKGVNWKDLTEDGFAEFSSIGREPLNIGNATDLRSGEPITPNTWHVQRKVPWPTLTRRMQFYIDQELYLELGEELPVYKEDRIGGNYPLRMNGGHTRHSIHTAWRDDTLLLRLQRGEPEMYMNVHDAQARGIKDHEMVRVYNDIGAFEIRAKVAASCAPGEVIVYHAWEPYMFKDGYSHQTLTPSPINPVELAGGYFHLRPMLFSCSPGQNDRGVRVEVAKLEKAGPHLGLRV